MIKMDGSVILERLRGCQRILLLQGPVGPFFSYLSDFLTESGKSVWKVNFNGGDEWFYRHPNAVAFKETPDRWQAFFDSLLTHRRIDAVVLFGDCRSIHRTAILRARFRKIPVYVFEEGYIRPSFITFEYGGVNGNSQLPRPNLLLDDLTAQPLSFPRNKPVFKKLVRYAVTYHIAGYAGRRNYPHYCHHKPFDIVAEARRWIKAIWRRFFLQWKEKNIARRLKEDLKKRYFLVPLQVYNDSQIKSHSGFGSMRAFITHVLQSFAEHAPDEYFLVFKHHPMDRGHRDYGPQIARQTAHLGITERVLYIHDQHLPTLLKNALGTITVNSTVGISSLYHGTPLKVLGRAVYDLEGLTCQDSLNAFWSNPVPPDQTLFHKFRNYLIQFTQVYGSFYSGEAIKGNRPVQPTVDWEMLHEQAFDELAA